MLNRKYSRMPAWRVRFALMVGVLAAPIQGWAGDQPSLIANTPWKYIVPATDAGHVVSARTVWLSDSRPSDLVVAFPTRDACYAEIRYGSSDSRRVAVVLTSDDNGEQQLYVDRDRDRKIAAADRLTGVGSQWQFRLDAEFVTADPNDLITEAREVLLQRGATDHILTLATLGYLEGWLRLDEGGMQARVADTDANGRFGDADDVLWCDVDRNGVWNLFLERMSCTPVIRLASRRYQFAGDEHGGRFQACLLSGTGSLRFNLGMSADQVLQYRILLVGRDGMALSAIGSEQLDEVPVGQYRVATLALALHGGGNDRTWNYLFSGIRSGENIRWCEVVENEQTRLDLLEGPQLSIDINEPQRRYAAGETFFATPRLKTDSGLIINNCWRGDDRRSWERDGGCATIRLGTASRSAVAATSGFA